VDGITITVSATALVSLASLLGYAYKVLHSTRNHHSEIYTEITSIRSEIADLRQDFDDKFNMLKQDLEKQIQNLEKRIFNGESSLAFRIARLEDIFLKKEVKK